MNQDEALRTAVALLHQSRRDDEPELAVDADRAHIQDGLLIVPYNSTTYLASRNVRDQLLDCWPILVDLTTGQARFGRLHERHLWRGNRA
ncbi:hypothetical protein [Streptacidiphilus rugosus]|uniref:hypothetical protein n=1 Tax=Streptacidiphilus rugosus TaxID=405783 RepID=UPI00055E31E5|nr:hypothetical protein [Streptacidiphilus rugosus]